MVTLLDFMHRLKVQTFMKNVIKSTCTTQHYCSIFFIWIHLWHRWHFNPLSSKPWWKWNFSLHDHYLFEYSSDKNKGSDHWGHDVLIFRQILLTNFIRNVWRSVMRICIFISGLKGLSIVYRFKVRLLPHMVLTNSTILLGSFHLNCYTLGFPLQTFMFM